ncbi:MAG: DUF971 domain-containing protein [Anaerolineales bacterium]|nr:DUF971 domain-containing protein [Anaerolineales bacterium]
MSLQPKRVTISRSKGEMVIEWDDGLQSEYPLAGLRAACPCAECRADPKQQEASEMLGLPVIDNRSIEIDRMEQVGNYAIKIIWKDGHSFGIYSWELLREMNPGLRLESDRE